MHPQHGSVEAYFCRLEDGLQTNLRWVKRYPAIGGRGLALECVDPLQDWRVSVDDDSFPVSGRFEGVGTPFLFDQVAIDATEGAAGPYDAYRHFVASGTWALERFGPDPVPEGLVGVRDRTWGVRTRRPRLHFWFVLRTGTTQLCLLHQELADGRIHFSQAGVTSPEGSTPLTVADHDLRLDPHTRVLDGGTVRLTGDGTAYEVRFERVGLGLRLAGAGYNDQQGTEESADTQQDSYDLTDPGVAAKTGRGTIDVGVTFSVTGDLTGEGIGVAESAVARDHVRYGPQIA